MPLFLLLGFFFFLLFIFVVVNLLIFGEGLGNLGLLIYVFNGSTGD